MKDSDLWHVVRYECLISINRVFSFTKPIVWKHWKYEKQTSEWINDVPSLLVNAYLELKDEPIFNSASL